MIADRAQLNVDALQPLAVSGQDAGKLIGVSPRTWRRLDAGGHVPLALRIGGGRCKRWSVDELLAWISAGAPTRARWEVLKINGSAAMARCLEAATERLRDSRS